MPRGIHSSPPRPDLVASNHMYWSASQYEGPYSERPYEYGDNQYVCVICGQRRGLHSCGGEHCPRWYDSPSRTSSLEDARVPVPAQANHNVERLRPAPAVPFKRHWKVVPKALP